MKNKRIIDSWNKIKPVDATNERMLAEILAYNNSGRNKNEKMSIKIKVSNWRRMPSVVACLVLIITAMVIVGNNVDWFQNDIYSIELGENDTLDFYKHSTVPEIGNIHFNVSTTLRDLTTAENKIMFDNIPITNSYATFNAEDKSLLRIEAKSDNIKVIFSTAGIPLTDIVIAQDGKFSTISGIPVSAGYFVTQENSNGIRNIIYFVSFMFDDISVYVDISGSNSESEDLREDIVSVIETIIQNGKPDFSKVTE